MSWKLTITNHYHDSIKALGIVIPPDKRPHKLDPTLGNGLIEVYGLGAVNFIDVGDQHIGGHSKATWGVLIGYQGEEVMFRYEGGGNIEVNINKFGQAELSGNGAFSQILLPSFVFKEAGAKGTGA